MNLLPKTHEEFSQVEYWNSFFKKRGKKSFDWYGEYTELCTILSKYVKTKDNILVVGCGNSTLSMSMYDVGYRSITNIDLSQVVIKQMQEVNKTIRPDLVYERMDATEMAYPDEKFSVILDKGTLDALMPDTKDATSLTVHKYFTEIKRTLRCGGRYLCISLLQEHILWKMLSFFPKEGFMFRVSRCQEVEAKARAEEGNLFPIFVVVATKFAKLTEPILEVALAEGQPERHDSTESVLNAVIGAQQSALVCNSLHKRSITDIGEVSLDLYRPGDKHPRYTVYVLDQPRVRQERTYAAFIVPQGKETDWLFGTKEGRQQVLKSAQRDRLAVVTLRREHTFESWETVKSELENCVRNLAPADLQEKSDIPFLSLGTDVGTRIILYEGKSDISGGFVVEEIETDGHSYRRLIFLDNPYVIQSEARLKEVKSRRGKRRKIVDAGHLACNHHVAMSVAVHAAIGQEESPEIMIVGLGGGGLSMFLYHCLAKVRMTVVEIDEAIVHVAEKYFELARDDRIKVKIADGIEFIKNSATSQTKRYKAILFDVDSKDTTLGISCPPRQFLESSVLRAVAQCLTEDGLFVLNLVSRDKSINQRTKDDLRAIFQSTSVSQLADEVNEIIVSSTNIASESALRNILKASARDITEEALRKKLIATREEFDVSTLFDARATSLNSRTVKT